MNETLNLARKWRSQTLDDVIGQELTVKIIKNSLFKGEIFPVYLLSGQRGCGKTTTGRLFAAALNCEQLEAFTKNPQTTKLPCTACASCAAMKQQAHPDFIEIDAASHTGVEHVRTIIEAATFLPVMGRKRVYLIDEAHMLSKAAFNAFLKILEEPPKTVVFFLATTEAAKIIDTVRSRCFQLFFDPIAPDVLSKHLAHICSSESIPYDTQALSTIVELTEGSARDAINMLERIRFLDGTVTSPVVAKTLLMPEAQWFSALIDYILQADELRTVAQVRQLPQTMPALLLWKKISEELFKRYYKAISQQHAQAPILLQLLEACYQAEELLVKTNTPTLMAELFVIKLLAIVRHKQFPDRSEPIKPTGSPVSEKRTPAPSTSVSSASTTTGPWATFLAQIEGLKDPLLASIFKQAQYDGISSAGQITLRFAPHYVFYQELLESSRAQWLPLMNKVFEREVSYNALFDESLKTTAVNKDKLEMPTNKETVARQKQYTVTKQPVMQSPTSEQARALLKAFPGTIVEVTE